ncbi:MAG: hypothetical protein ABGY96_04450 [bacterium]|nr:hypothetical protein [Gammaproteobacteria bacterium]HIL97404.1 hypothetical protein [Pseudomonadales bacterium]
MDQFVDTVVATADPPPKGVPNPIHDAAGADAAGYAGALVAGVRTYGWAAATIARALGEQWLDRGWVDYSLKRPLYAGDALRTVVKRDGKTWAVTCRAGNEGDERVVLDGTAGLDEAPWLGDLKPPVSSPGLDALDLLPGYDLEHVPLWQPLRPLAVFVSADAARNMVDEDLGLTTERYLQTKVEPGFVHPYFLAARMAPLTRHNFTYGPTIHVRSQIQHRREARSDHMITVGAQIVDAYDRNDHWYQVLDGIVSDDMGELATIRHHTIFRPRGT